MIGIFQRVFAAKKVEDDAISDAYHSMLRSLAMGEEIDLEDVKRLTVGKSEEECSRDLETMQQRIEKVAQRKKWLEVQKTSPELQKKYDALLAELNAVIAKIQPQLIRLEWEIGSASDAGAQVIWCNDFLSRTCLNHSLLEREQEVGEQRKELALKKNPLSEDLEKAQQRLSYFHSRLGKKGLSDRERKELQSSQDEWQSTVEQLEIQKEKLMP
ncbi:MAG: hypothetical protein NTY42_12210 [Planctomycetota bacterium]|nr:hypothetical protein [Planctomycetota bacterium]